MSEPGPSSSPAQQGRSAAALSSPNADAITPTRRATRAQQRALFLNSPQHSSNKRVRRHKHVQEGENQGAELPQHKQLPSTAGHASREERRQMEARERAELEAELRDIERDVSELEREYKWVQRRRERRRKPSSAGRDTAQSVHSNNNEDEASSSDGESGGTSANLFGLVSPTGRARLDGSDVDEEAANVGAHAATDIKALEAMLREMDDNDLASLLTHGTALPSTLLEHLQPAESLPTVVPPARSAGVEGTGSGRQIDDEEARLASATNNARIEEELEQSLRTRLERNDELLDGLSRFSSIDLTNIESDSPVRAKTNPQRLLRRISIRGTLAGNLGQMTIHMEVEEDESTRESPQIVGLDVEIGDPVFAAIGSQQISRYVDKVNLPALLLAIRTLIPLAQLRYRFFASIAMLYPNLARNHIEHLAARGITLTGQKRQGSAGPSVPSLATLIDPDTMGSLQLQSDRGATLDVLFAIEFNQWGHARPHLSVAPTISSLAHLPRKAREVLARLPQRFSHLCAHCPSHADTRAALVATIDAFFAL